jgi:hypothetical protein
MRLLEQRAGETRSRVGTWMAAYLISRSQQFRSVPVVAGDARATDDDATPTDCGSHALPSNVHHAFHSLCRRNTPSRFSSCYSPGDC